MVGGMPAADVSLRAAFSMPVSWFCSLRKLRAHQGRPTTKQPNEVWRRALGDRPRGAAQSRLGLGPAYAFAFTLFAFL